MRDKILELLDLAREKKAIIYYDPNFRSSHKDEAMKLAPTIIENLEYSNIVRGSADDFSNLYHLKDVDKVYKDKIKFYCPNFIYTAGSEAVSLRTDKIAKEYSISPLEVASSIGAGDNFNAGVIYGLLKSGVRHRDLDRINGDVWDEIIRYGMAFAANSCTSLNNSIAPEFAKTLPSVN